MDVFARSEDGKEEWAIQCKRYRKGKTLGPSIVRELIGSLAAYPPGTRGAVVTTAKFSSNAKALAAENDILLIDGYEWSQLVSVEFH